MIDYKKSGVDIQAGDDLVSWLQNPLQKTQISEKKLKVKSDVGDLKSRVVSGIGGFAALFDGSFQNYKNPLLVSSTDGVGTKVKVASYFNDYSLVGQDLVAMCVNDLICTGGTPLFFLDYYASGRLDLNAAKSFLTSVKQACEESHLVLIGGETAEMPGVYQEGDFDCAGFSVGVVDKDLMWGAHQVNEGDVVLGVESSGYHSNGYSLIRKVFEGEFDKYKDWLMKPTELYVKAALTLKEKKCKIHAAAHMTGGGIENLPRVLPEHLKAVIKKWKMPDCFLEVQKRASLNDQQMYETFNCGIGFVFILPESSYEQAVQTLQQCEYKIQKLGSIQRKTTEESHVQWD